MKLSPGALGMLLLATAGIMTACATTELSLEHTLNGKIDRVDVIRYELWAPPAGSPKNACFAAAIVHQLTIDELEDEEFFSIPRDGFVRLEDTAIKAAFTPSQQQSFKNLAANTATCSDATVFVLQANDRRTPFAYQATIYVN